MLQDLLATSSIYRQISILQAEIDQAESDTLILAVSKYAEDEQVLAAYLCGLNQFGENFVMPALERMQRLAPQFLLLSTLLEQNQSKLANKFCQSYKEQIKQERFTDIQTLISFTNQFIEKNFIDINLFENQNLHTFYSSLNIFWHLTGSLQKNKVNKVVGIFDLIHSVDSIELAEKISKRSELLGINQKCLVQINLSQEESKSGFSEDEIDTVYEKISSLPSIKLSGLMTMAAQGNLEKAETIFKKMSLNKSRLVSKLAPARSKDLKLEKFELSMGMSDDFGLAIKNKSTIIRIGRFLFS